MSLTVLVPHAIAERCYLSEALLWVAVSRFPLGFIAENGVDARVEPAYIEGLDPYLPFDDPVNHGECKSVGLPPNPEYEAHEAGEWHQTPENIRTLLQYNSVDESHRTELQRELQVSIAFERRCAAWDAEFNSFADVHKIKLFLSLREGRLPAFGKMLPRRSYSASLNHLAATDWEGWDKVTWGPIPPDFWISDKIDWNTSRAEGRGLAWCLILIETEVLMKCFPPPAAEQPGNVVKIANDLVLIGDDAVDPQSSARRGRPAFDWDAFHLEITRRLHANGLPKKQEALVAEMQAWCGKAWRRDVGRSTILQKVKPYYDAFVRPSESKKIVVLDRPFGLKRNANRGLAVSEFAQ